VQHRCCASPIGHQRRQQADDHQRDGKQADGHHRQDRLAQAPLLEEGGDHPVEPGAHGRAVAQRAQEGRVVRLDLADGRADGVELAGVGPLRVEEVAPLVAEGQPLAGQRGVALRRGERRGMYLLGVGRAGDRRTLQVHVAVPERILRIGDREDADDLDHRVAGAGRIGLVEAADGESLHGVRQEALPHRQPVARRRLGRHGDFDQRHRRRPAVRQAETGQRQPPRQRDHLSACRRQPAVAQDDASLEAALVAELEVERIVEWTAMERGGVELRRVGDRLLVADQPVERRRQRLGEALALRLDDIDGLGSAERWRALLEHRQIDDRWRRDAHLVPQPVVRHGAVEARDGREDEGGHQHQAGQHQGDQALHPQPQQEQGHRRERAAHAAHRSIHRPIAGPIPGRCAAAAGRAPPPSPPAPPR
jgi:hypothetical protein